MDANPRKRIMSPSSTRSSSSNETPVPLANLRLGPGQYCLHVDGGKTAKVALTFRLMPGGGPGPGGGLGGAPPPGSGRTFTWSLRPPGQQANYIDYLTVAPDGRSFSGVNNFGNRVNAIKR